MKAEKRFSGTNFGKSKYMYSIFPLIRARRGLHVPRAGYPVSHIRLLSSDCPHVRHIGSTDILVLRNAPLKCVFCTHLTYDVRNADSHAEQDLKHVFIIS